MVFILKGRRQGHLVQTELLSTELSPPPLNKYNVALLQDGSPVAVFVAFRHPR